MRQGAALFSSTGPARRGVRVLCDLQAGQRGERNVSVDNMEVLAQALKVRFVDMLTE